jgi:DUF4097 and DUF4098 domain-containing protein YvlB
MTARSHRFPVAGSTPALHIRNPSGTVVVEAREGAQEVVVDVEALDAGAEALLDRVEISAVHGQVRVTASERKLFRSSSFAVRVQTPAGADTRVETASASVDLQGRLGDVRVSSASGDVDVEECAALTVRTASGDTRVGAVQGHARVGSASGSITVRSAGDGLDARTASGSVSVGEATGSVTAGTASGSVSVGAIGSGEVRARTASGNVEVGVVPGLRVWMDLASMSGRMESQLTESGPEDDGADAAQVSLSLRTMSGNLLIRRAAAAR